MDMDEDFLWIDAHDEQMATMCNRGGKRLVACEKFVSVLGKGKLDLSKAEHDIGKTKALLRPVPADVAVVDSPVEDSEEDNCEDNAALQLIGDNCEKLIGLAGEDPAVKQALQWLQRTYVKVEDGATQASPSKPCKGKEQAAQGGQKKVGGTACAASSKRKRVPEALPAGEAR